MTNLIITRPDDWHVHLRDGDFLKTTVPDAAKQFGRAIVMPNLKPPITQALQAIDYRARILEALPTGHAFNPLMTLYLTDNTTPDIITAAKETGAITACKLYPAGSTTHSDNGVSSIDNLTPVLAAMEQHDLPLLIHGEVTDYQVDVFDREAVFIDKILSKIVKQFPQLRIVLEHITTQDAVEFVTEASSKIAATITAHHLLMNRNDILVGGIKPHHYCLPVLKRQTHQAALIKAAVSGSPKFFLGTDSAPHTQETKESNCGCAGIYTAHAAIELYAEAFENANALDKLEAFASFYGPDFYQLPRNQDKITLVRQDWVVPDSISYANSKLIPFRAGMTVHWKLQDTYE